MKRRDWLTTEIKFLKQQLFILSHAEIAAALGRSTKAVGMKVHKQGLAKPYRRQAKVQGQ